MLRTKIRGRAAHPPLHASPLRLLKHFTTRAISLYFHALRTGFSGTCICLHVTAAATSWALGRTPHSGNNLFGADALPRPSSAPQHGDRIDAEQHGVEPRAQALDVPGLPAQVSLLSAGITLRLGVVPSSAALSNLLWPGNLPRHRRRL